MTAEAVFFGAPERARFGWIHAPAGGAHDATGVGLVIVPPFGYEAICAYRALRVLAERAAAAGVLAVQLDLDGTGDSAGDDLDLDRLDAWLASIDDACELARGAGARRLVLAGVRLGATLAALAAARRRDVAGVIAIAAVPSGKALVREMRMLQLALALAPPPAATEGAPDEVVGFALTEATRAALAAIDLTREATAPAPAVLVIDREDGKPNDAWVAALRALGTEVTHVRLPGYAEMVLDPHHAQTPGAILDAAVAFAAARPPLAAPPPPSRVIASSSGATFGAVVEEAVALLNGCRAIASWPAATAEPRRAVVLLNAGAIRGIGPNRLHVTLARQLATRGDLVVRVDLSGLGASAGRGADNVVYAPQAVREVGAIVAWARKRGAAEVAVVGLCSGAYHALRAAIEGYPIDVVVAINPLTFRYEPGMPLDVQPHKVTETAARYQRSVRSLDAWKKLLRGGVDLRGVARTVALRARDRGLQLGRDAARRLRIPLRDDLGSELRALAKRGVRVRFVFAASDPGHALLVEGAGPVVDELAATGALAITTLAGPDHTFTARWTHAPFLAAVAAALGARR